MVCKLFVIGDDKYRAENETAGTSGNANNYEFDLATPEGAITGVTIDHKDGSIIEGTPIIWYVKDTKVTDSKVTFKLDDANHRLIVEYATTLNNSTDNGVEYDAVAWAARKEVEYKNQLGISNSAIKDYNQKNADYTYRKALNDAKNDLIDAASARNNFSNAYSGTTGTKQALETAWTNVKTQADTTAANYYTQVANFVPVSTLIPTDVQNTINSDISLVQCKSNLDEMTRLEGEINTLAVSLQQSYDNLRTVAGDQNNQLPAQTVENIVNDCKTKLDTLSSKITAYKDAFADLVADTSVTSLLNTQTTNTQKEKLQGIVTAIPGIKSSLDAVIGDYKTAWNDNENAKTNDSNAASEWQKAINDYNTAVEDAKKAYEDVVVNSTPPQPLKPSDTSNYQNNNDTIVNAYAAVNSTNNGPKINDINAALSDYATYAAMPKDSAPSSEEKTVAYDKAYGTNGEVSKTNTAKVAYDDAVLALDSSSKITIYVNLDSQYKTNWTMDGSTDNQNTVKFYYNSVLDAGQTTNKLIDSVVLANTVSAKDYKNLTFDLNVALDSAQITYADDQKTITTTAVVEPTFRLKATVGNNNSTVTWSDPTAVPSP